MLSAQRCINAAMHCPKAKIKAPGKIDPTELPWILVQCIATTIATIMLASWTVTIGASQMVSLKLRPQPSWKSSSEPRLSRSRLFGSAARNTLLVPRHCGSSNEWIIALRGIGGIIFAFAGEYQYSMQPFPQPSTQDLLQIGICSAV